ncbi:hypothetical protein E3N88_38048 [Mikania micrantha]|uniref:Uncharacterized protein n=1 Tax=Mikania micrantha TaxID=192012 RepID=A0A5N6LSX9_9ASTR|nr:hypothetical protein E3N88_38048 [Mikania micrantha]
MRRRLYLTSLYYDDVPYLDTVPASSTYQEVYQLVADYNYRLEWDCNSYGPEMPPYIGYQEEYDSYPNCQENVASPIVEPVHITYQYEEEKQIAQLDLFLSKINELLSSDHLTDQQMVECLNYKCEVLSMRIDVRMQFSEGEKEVVENNTTPTPSIEDEPYSLDMVDGEVIEKVVMDLPKHEVKCVYQENVIAHDEPVTETLLGCFNHPLLHTIQSDKVGDDGSRIKKRKVRLQDVEHIIQKWSCKNFKDMMIMRKWMWIHHVNCRAYLASQNFEEAYLGLGDELRGPQYMKLEFLDETKLLVKSKLAYDMPKSDSALAKSSGRRFPSAPPISRHRTLAQVPSVQHITACTTSNRSEHLVGNYVKTRAAAKEAAIVISDSPA